MSSPKTIVRLIAVVALTALAACTNGSSTANNGGWISSDGSIRVLARDTRKTAPPIHGRTVTGDVIDARDSVGHVIVLNFWASWCAPCRAEAPLLRHAYNAYRPKGVDFIGIDIQDNDSSARAFERNYRIRYPSIIDQPGSIALSFGGTVPNYPPNTVFIDTDGRVAARIIGRLPRGVLEPLLDQLLNPSATATPVRVPG